MPFAVMIASPRRSVLSVSGEADASFDSSRLDDGIGTSTIVATAIGLAGAVFRAMTGRGCDVGRAATLATPVRTMRGVRQATW